MKDKRKKKEKVKFEFPFGKKNYTLMFTGLLVIAIGYILMAGGGPESPDEFRYDIFSARRIVVAPLVVLAGLVLEVYAIMADPGRKENEDTAK